MTVSKASELFTTLTRNAVSTSTQTNGTIVANMGNGNFITFRTATGPLSPDVIATINLNFPQLFSGNNPVPQSYNWTINQATAINTNPASASTDATVTNGIVKTRIFTNNVPDATNMSMARTFIHEAFHAYLVFVYRYQNIDKSYANLINQFASQFNNNPNDIHHAVFVQANIISEIKTALIEYGSSQGYNLPNQYYEDMAWGGLTHIEQPSGSGNFIINPAFNQAVPNTADQQRIISRLDAEKNNQIVNGIQPQGTKACP